MPRNNRPNTYLGGFNPEWWGSTQTERKLAQNQYDIQVQLEELNNKLSNSQNNNYEDIKWEREYKEEQERKKLQQIKNIIINYLNLNEDTFDQFIDKLDGYDSILKKEQEKLNSLRKEQLEQQAKAYNKYNPSILLLLCMIFTTAGGFILLPFCAFGVIKSFSNFYFQKYIPIWIIITVIYMFYDKVYLKIKKKNCQTLLDDIKKQETDIQFQQEKLNYKIQQASLNNYNKFKDFRRTHYNEEIELQLKKLNYNFGIINPIIKEGTIQDYTNYILEELNLKDKVLEQETENILKDESITPYKPTNKKEVLQLDNIDIIQNFIDKK